MDKVVYQNQNKGKLFKNNSGGSVQTELAATGNIFDANQNKYKVALIKEVYATAIKTMLDVISI